MAAAVRLACDLPLARRLARAARATAQEITWERIVADFEKVLIDVAAR